MRITQYPSTKKDILQHLLKQDRATAQQLAASLEISAQATRRHLQDLEAEGLIEHKSVQQGMGRPQHLYQLSQQGRSSVAAIVAPSFPQRYGEFAVSVLDTLTETIGEEKASEVLRKQWERKAIEYRDRLGKVSLQERMHRLVELRQEEGYMAELLTIEDNNLGNEKREKFFLAEHNCAISEVAESYPSVCGHELEMFATVLPDCTVERTHWINNGEHRCGYLIQSKCSSS